MRLRFNVNGNRNGNGNRNSKPNLPGSILGFAFMLYWTYSAVRGGAPWIFWLFGGFGLYTTGVGLLGAIKAFAAQKRNSRFDGMLSDNEPNPWDKDFEMNTDTHPTAITAPQTRKRNFCPYCGAQVGADYIFCEVCGRQFPD